MLTGNKGSAIAAHTTLLSSRIRHTQPAVALSSSLSLPLLPACRLFRDHRCPVIAMMATPCIPAPVFPAAIGHAAAHGSASRVFMQFPLLAKRTRLCGATRSSTITKTTARTLAVVLRVFTIHGIASACGRSAMHRFWPIVAPEAFIAS